MDYKCAASEDDFAEIDISPHHGRLRITCVEEGRRCGVHINRETTFQLLSNLLDELEAQIKKERGV
jgi:hypothetical protein